MSLDFTGETLPEGTDIIYEPYNNLLLKDSINRRLITTLDPDTLELAHVPEIGEFDNKRVDEIMKQYDLETLLRFPGILIECFLYRAMPEDSLRKYSLSFDNHGDGKSYMFDIRERVKGNKKFNQVSKVFLDTFHSGALFYGDIPIAIIGIEYDRNNNAYITQIQSSRFDDFDLDYCKIDRDFRYRSTSNSYNFFVEGFNWKKVLVKLTEKYLKEQRVDNIFINSASINSWDHIKYNSDQGCEGYEIYDQTALDLDYNQIINPNHVRKNPQRYQKILK